MAVPLPARSATPSLSQKTLQNDLLYYHKVAREKNLNVNDRSFILFRIQEKYQDSGLNLTPLENELKKFDGTGTPVPAAQQHNAVLSSAGKVEKILVTDTERDSQVIISASGVKRTNYFLLRDPDPAQPSKLVFDLYGVKTALSEAAMDITTKKGVFSRIQTAQFEDEPNNIVRVSAEMRLDRPYKVKKETGRWIIVAEKETAPRAQAAQPLPAVAVAVSSPAAPAVPADNKAAPKKNDSTLNYRIEVGDVLGVSVYPTEELSREVVVQPDGKILFPLISAAEAKGYTLEQLKNSMESALSKFISAPQVTLTVKTFSRRQIFIIGEVHSVGTHKYKENLRLMEFISSLGGFTSDANRKEVKVYRGPATQRVTHKINVEEIIQSGDFSKDFLLEPGDIIEVTKGQMKVAVLGAVGRAGYYDHRDNLSLIELISLAGGFGDVASTSNVTIIHASGTSQQRISKVNLNRILAGKDKDISIQPGDTVFVPKKGIVTANWFLSTIMPWLSLITLALALRGGF